MPPSPKFTKEEVLEKALEILRADGESALTARKLGEALGSSPRPIFTLFSGMDELKEELIPLADDFFYKFCEGFGNYTPAFKKIGLSIVTFAEDEPNLFAFLFMSKRSKGKTLDEWRTDKLGNEAIKILMRDYGLDEKTASLFFNEIWLHNFALCVLKVTGAAEVTAEQCSDSMSRIFLGLYSLAKADRLTDEGIRPVMKGGADHDMSVADVPGVQLEDPGDA